MIFYRLLLRGPFVPVSSGAGEILGAQTKALVRIIVELASFLTRSSGYSGCDLF